MKQIIRKAIEDIINNQMNGVCEGALWVEHNYYGPYREHYNDPYEVINALDRPQYTTEISYKTEVNIYLVPEGEGYKNFNNTYANHNDWMQLVHSYDWLLACTVILDEYDSNKHVIKMGTSAKKSVSTNPLI